MKEEPVPLCCEARRSPQEELAHLAGSGNRTAESVCRAAHLVAEICGNVPRETLMQCFSRLFDLPPECRLCVEFVMTYELERTACAAADSAAPDSQRTTQRQAAGLGAAT